MATNKHGGLGSDPERRSALLSHIGTYTAAYVPAFIWLADSVGGWIVLLAVAVASTGLALLLYWTNSLRLVDQATVDARFSIRGDEKPPKDLIVVGIDDYTFGTQASGGLAVRFQDWPRTFHAQVLRNLH